MGDVVKVRCYETMGVPNAEASCTACGAVKTYYPGEARRGGHRTTLGAAEWWANAHVCPTDRVVPDGDQVMDWVRRKFPDRSDMEARAAKLAEEAGEVVGAVNRIVEGRGKPGHLATELAQLHMCLVSLASVAGIDLEQAIAAEWADMQTRVWTTSA